MIINVTETALKTLWETETQNIIFKVKRQGYVQNWIYCIWKQDSCYKQVFDLWHC